MQCNKLRGVFLTLFYWTFWTHTGASWMLKINHAPVCSDPVLFICAPICILWHTCLLILVRVCVCLLPLPGRGVGGWGFACTGACVDAAHLFFTCVARSWYFLFWLVSHTRSGCWKHDLALHLILYGWKKCHLS